MSIRTAQFAAILLTALVLIPVGAHLLELSSKIGLDQERYLTVQQIYRGWAFLGALIVAAVVANLALAIASRRQRTPMLSALGASILLGLTLGVFFVWTFPVNQATANWTTAPGDWEALRATWEYSHAANAVLTLLALCATIVACLSWRDAPSRART
jgi:hypothetical protein